jgi:SEC-C motif-containing protein
MAPKRRKKRKLGRPSICACGGPKIYAACCKPFHAGDALPQEPVALMKSRYTAYALGLVDYIIETTDPEGDAWEHDHDPWRASIEAFSERNEFLGVRIVDHEVDGDSGMVHFEARLRDESGGDATFEERSSFVRRDGRWLYSSGDVDP